MSPAPTRAELLESEKSLMRPAGIAALTSVAFFVTSGYFQSSAGGENLDTAAGSLVQYSEHGGTLLTSAIFFALGSLCLTLPLYVLFRAIQARTNGVRNALVAFCFIGPLLLAIQAPLGAIGSQEAADKFLEQHTVAEAEQVEDDDDPVEQDAEEVGEESALLSVAGPLTIPAILGLIVGVFYNSLWAMRTGLMSRFWGSFGMATAIALVILQSAIYLILLWLLALGLLLLGRWPGGRPPAWEAGVAMPPARRGGQQTPGPEGTLEGSGRDVSGEDGPESNGDGGQNGSGGTGDPGPGAGGGPAGGNGPELPPGPTYPPRKRKRRE